MKIWLTVEVDLKDKAVEFATDSVAAVLAGDTVMGMIKEKVEWGKKTEAIQGVRLVAATVAEKRKS